MDTTTVTREHFCNVLDIQVMSKMLECHCGHLCANLAVNEEEIASA